MSTLPFFHTFIIPFISSFPSLCQLKKDAKCKNLELNFIWGKIKTAVWETAPQIVLRKCSNEVVGEVNIILVKGEFSAIKHVFYKRFSAHAKELMST